MSVIPAVTVRTSKGHLAWFRTGQNAERVARPAKPGMRKQPPTRPRAGVGGKTKTFGGNSMGWYANKRRRAVGYRRGAIRKWATRPVRPPPRPFSHRALSIRRTPHQMYSDLNEFGSNMEPAHTYADNSKVVDEVDDLHWLDQYGSMDYLFAGADSDSDLSDDVDSGSETHVEVEW